MTTDPHDGTLVARSTGERLLLAVGLPVLAAAVAEAVNLLAPAVAGLPWAPLQGPFRLVARLPEPYTTIGAVLLGVLVGLLLALVAAAEEVAVRVSDAAVTITRDKAVRTVRRAEIGAVFVADGDLVLLGAGTEELARQSVDLDAGKLGAAFVRHGYPWHPDGDPHSEQYRRWVPGLPELPAAADALLTARAGVVGKDADDAAELRTELAALGVVVSDRDGRQHYRLSPPRRSPVPD
ncbi:hypothetical protein Athai_25580 [Actinocatenispora thailandica]|uniref:DUF308 domain-containing protein n=1 Tax=Actinocatenispora thailandica TaxID=227318 RepID=A0A7R7DNM8_9ACTN|nr:hypothetical protein [Actinocatenispora thailandica]BCJ35055.1 hypothetical protein Athai_25580 [Actinocatenispora thailandica]